MYIKALIGLAVQRLDRKSVRALAERMGIAHGVLYEWRDGKKPVPDERIQQIAKIAGQDPGEWLLLIHSEQDQGELGREWAKLHKRLSMTAIALVLCIGAALPGRAEAAMHHALEANNSALDIHYAK
ncbi:DUF3693 domain-containing protein [Xanthomonas campestris pv. campestris]|uniref:DUF3693 domain-containing protein n=1 Tax=Xanthomonas campestris TaxID=339 RepID=UPI0025A19C92|nr:DUF3693 domain-containing protein [Xanthomonas campestris]MDM7697582.1 DUF3693 domain-containing protein [Xanthomonas campestris pv. campestris]